LFTGQRVPGFDQSGRRFKADEVVKRADVRESLVVTVAHQQSEVTRCFQRKPFLRAAHTI
jgi:hypothetical protein